MWSSLWHVLAPAAGLLVVLAVWFLLQAFIRSGSHKEAGEDVLEHMTHGCAGCTGNGACHNRTESESAACQSEIHIHEH